MKVVGRGDKKWHLPAKNAPYIICAMKFCRKGHAVQGENRLEFNGGRRVLCKLCTNAGYNRRYRKRHPNKRLVNSVAIDAIRILERIVLKNMLDETDKDAAIKVILTSIGGR